MYGLLKIALIISLSLLLVGCVPAGTPKPSLQKEPHIGTPIRRANDYGYPPRSYRQTIKNYFSNRLPRGEHASYVFSAPKRAYKRKGLAYGGDIAWRGWLVDVAITLPSRTGRMQKPKPYMVLFRGDAIVEDILGSHHQLITRVGE